MVMGKITKLKDKKCQPCEGGVAPVARNDSQKLLEEMSGWSLTDDARRIRREWVVKNFAAGMKFLNRVAQLAEDEGHHPDIQLTGYRNVAIELTTHAIGGLSENDFILAAKISDLPVELKSQAT